MQKNYYVFINFVLSQIRLSNSNNGHTMRRLLSTLILMVVGLGAAMAVALQTGYLWRKHDVLHIAISSWPPDELLALAEARGFFRDAGIDAKLHRMDDITAIRNAVRFDGVDGGTMTLVEMLNLHAVNSVPTKIVLLQDFSNGADVITASKAIQNIASLRGKKVGVESSSVGILLLAEALTSQNMRLDDVNVIAIEQSEIATALAAGVIDAAVFYPPYTTEILRDARFHRLFDSSQISGTIIDVLVLRAEEYEAHKAQLPRLIAVWDRAVRYAREHPDEFRQLLMTRESMTAAEADNALGGINILDANDMRRLIERRMEARAIERTKDVFLTPTERVKAWPAEQYIELKPLFGAMAYKGRVMQPGNITVNQ